MISYTVYTKPECPNCEKTTEYFDRKGVLYSVVDVTESRGALGYITEELGYSQVPVIVSSADAQDHWSGLRLDKLVQASMAHKKALTEATFWDEDGDFDHEAHFLATRSQQTATDEDPGAAPGVQLGTEHVTSPGVSDDAQHRRPWQWTPTAV